MSSKISLQCCKCTQRFSQNNEPFDLLCDSHHIVCAKCLNKMKQEGPQELQCNYCTQIININDAKVNEMLLQIIDMLKEKEKIVSQKYASQIENLKNIIRDLRQKMRKLQNEANQSQQQINNLKQLDSSSKNKLNLLQQRYEELFVTNGHLQKIIKEKETEIVKKGQQIQELKTEIRSLTDTNNEVKILKQENYRISNKIKSSQLSWKQLKCKFDQVSKIFQDMNSSFSSQLYGEQKIQQNQDKEVQELTPVSKLYQNGQNIPGINKKQNNSINNCSDEIQRAKQVSSQLISSSFSESIQQSPNSNNSEKSNPKQAPLITMSQESNALENKINSASLSSVNSKNVQIPIKQENTIQSGKQTVTQPKKEIIQNNNFSQAVSNKDVIFDSSKSFISQRQNNNPKQHHSQTFNKQYTVNAREQMCQEYWQPQYDYPQNNGYYTFQQQQYYYLNYLMQRSQQNYHVNHKYYGSNYTDQSNWNLLQQQKKQSHFTVKTSQQSKKINQIVTDQEIFITKRLQKQAVHFNAKLQIIQKIKRSQDLRYNKLYQQLMNFALTAIKEVILTSMNIEQIIDLRELNKLEKLDLSHNRIKTIKGFLNNGHIKILLLNDNQIEKLDNLIGFKDLHKISLHNNKLRKDAAEFFSKCNYSKLEQVSISFLCQSHVEERLFIKIILSKNWPNLKQIYYGIVKNLKQLQYYRSLANDYNRIYQRSQDKLFTIVV